MHIVLVTNRLITGEGQGRVNAEIARAASREGHTVTCLAHDVENELLMEPGVEWTHMPDANAPFALLGNIRYAAATTRWLQEYGDDADVVVANGANTWNHVDVNIVHFVHSAWRASPVHDSQVRRDLYGSYQWLYSTVNARAEHHALPRARCVVPVSEKVRTELLGIGLPDDHLHVIHNGVDIEEFQPGQADQTALGLPQGVSLGLFAGDIRTPRKGLDVLIQALEHVPNAHIAVAGRVDGSPYPALAERVGVGARVHFLDYRRDIPTLMQAADFFAFPSRYEACSLVLLEAMAAGLPILTARTAGGAELVAEEAGIVIDDPDDMDALVEALSSLATSQSEWAEMSRAARAIAEANSWERMASRYLALFENLMHSRQTPRIISASVA